MTLGGIHLFNKIILVGRLTKDPELRYTPSGKAVASFRLAVDRGTGGGGQDREADFIDVVVWEKQAEHCSQYLSKGRLTLVEGRLQMRQFDAQDGTRRTVYEVVAASVRFLPDGKGGAAPRSPAPSAGPAGAGGAPGSLGVDFDPADDDVPF